MAKALDDFRRLVSYSNLNASALTWNEPLDMVLNGDAAMTIMGDWGKGYANSQRKGAETFGAVPTPGTADTFVFTTDTFGLTMGAQNARDTTNLLKLFGSREGQDIFNPIKGSISARSDSDISNDRYDAMAKQTFYDFTHTDAGARDVDPGAADLPGRDRPGARRVRERARQRQPEHRAAHAGQLRRRAARELLADARHELSLAAPARSAGVRLPEEAWSHTAPRRGDWPRAER